MVLVFSMKKVCLLSALHKLQIFPIFSRRITMKTEGRRFSTNHVTSSTNFKYGSLVTAVCTHRCPPPSCHHIVLRKGGSFYTDVGKITHEVCMMSRILLLDAWQMSKQNVQLLLLLFFPVVWTFEPKLHLFQAITELCDGSVVELGVQPVSCQVLFHKTRRDDFIDYRFGEKAKSSRRFVHPSDLQSLCSIIGIQVTGLLYTRVELIQGHDT